MPRSLVRTYIDPEIREKFEERFGKEYGAISFLTESAMREVLEMTADDPKMDELFRAAVRRSVLKTQFNAESGE